MTFSEIKKAVCDLPPEKRRELSACMAALEKLDDPAYVEEMAHRAHDRTPGNWMSLEEARRRLGLGDGQGG